MEITKQNILIVDDSRFNLTIMQHMLQGNYNIFCATTGKEALAILASEIVDLILLDVIMPEMDGYEVCKRIKADARTKNIPVIFVSSMEEEEDETRGLEIGAIDYITKPVSQPIFRARVKNHLELKQYRDILEKLSLVDGLTGIANRRYLDEYLEKEWRRALRSGNDVSIILLDIDFFKQYNDHYGHLAGDDCLRQVGCALKESVKRAGDFVARYGGEEFAVVLPSTDRKGALVMAEKLRAVVESLQIPHHMSTINEYVTISAGIATAQPVKDMTLSCLIISADKALYEAKKQGRNRICG